MLITPVKCTECGAVLQVDKDKDAAVCPHCNTPFIIEKAINNYLGTIGQNDFEIRAGMLIKYNGAEDDVIIPSNVTIISKDAFKDCIGLRSAEIPDSVAVIEEFAFYGCIHLTNVILPDSITSIGNGLFANCSALSSVVIPDSVTSIGRAAFRGCSALTSITIPDSIMFIEASAFYGCTSLSSVNGKPADEFTPFKITVHPPEKSNIYSNNKNTNLNPAVKTVLGVFAKFFIITAALMIIFEIIFFISLFSSMW